MKAKKIIIVLVGIMILFGTSPTVTFGGTTTKTTHATGEKYVNYEKGYELSTITNLFINQKYPTILFNKYVGWLGVNGEHNLDQVYKGKEFDYHYINMLEVVNLFSDGSHTILPSGKHKFTFGGNVVEFGTNSNTVTINGQSSYVGKIRYADSNKDSYRRGRFFGSKFIYDQSIKTYNTWIPAEAVDEVLQFGSKDIGNSNKYTGSYSSYGIKVPDVYKKKVYNKTSYSDLIYSQMKAKLPQNIKLQIKENFNSNLLFGEDFTNIDNYDQVAKAVHYLFSQSKIARENENFAEYSNLTEAELADKFREKARNHAYSMDFYDSYYRMESNLYIEVYLDCPEKANGISFSIRTLNNNENTVNLMFGMLKDIYPYEIAETIIKDTISGKTMDTSVTDPGNNKFYKFNVVQASGPYKYFYGSLPQDLQSTDWGNTYFLIDNHPALPNEVFCSGNASTYYDDHYNPTGDMGRGYREDFFTFSPLPSDVRKSLGMPEIYDMINYNFLSISPYVRTQDGTTKTPLQKCTCNPYGTYRRLS